MFACLRPGRWRVQLLGYSGLMLAEHSFVAMPSFSEFADGPDQGRSITDATGLDADRGARWESVGRRTEGGVWTIR